MNHCINCGNNIPDEVKTCNEAGFGDDCEKTLATVPKDYQEVERIVETFAAKFTYSEGHELHNQAVYPYPLPKVQAWLRDTLATYGNLRELQGVEEIIKIAKEKSINIGGRKWIDSSDFIEAIKE